MVTLSNYPTLTFFLGFQCLTPVFPIQASTTPS